MRCLLIKNWSEDGVYWAVKYLLNRLSDIRQYRLITNAFIFGRSRSNSVPRLSSAVSRGSRHDILNAEHLTWSDLQERANQLDRRTLGASSLGQMLRAEEVEGGRFRVEFNVDASK